MMSPPPSQWVTRSLYGRWIWPRSLLWCFSQFCHFSTNLLPIVSPTFQLNSTSLCCPCSRSTGPASAPHSCPPLPTLGYWLLQARCSGHAAAVLGRVCVVMRAGQRCQAAPEWLERKQVKKYALTWLNYKLVKQIKCECDKGKYCKWKSLKIFSKINFCSSL